jgi:hypothetical protein
VTRHARLERLGALLLVRRLRSTQRRWQQRWHEWESGRAHFEVMGTTLGEENETERKEGEQRPPLCEQPLVHARAVWPPSTWLAVVAGAAGVARACQNASVPSSSTSSPLAAVFVLMTLVCRAALEAPHRAWHQVQE